VRKRLKVLHAAETMKGGVETVIRNLVSVDEHEYVYVLPRNQVDAREAYAHSRYNFVRSGRNLVSVILFTWGLMRALLRERPDVVHLHSSIAGVVGRPMCFVLGTFVGARVVYCPHAFGFLMEMSVTKRRGIVFAERVLSKMCARVICVSRHEFREAMASGIPEAKLRLVYNGTAVDGSPARPSRPSHPIRLLYVGRFDYQKGVDVLCEAMRLVTPGRFALTLVGGAVRDDTDMPAFPPHSRVLEWCGPAELDAIYSLADVLVVPSRWEGFAMVPLEAMARGVPVVASDCTSLPEVVSDGVNGFLFSSGCARSLAKVLQDIVPEALAGLGECALETVRRSFSIADMAANTSTVYHEVSSGAEAT